MSSVKPGQLSGHLPNLACATCATYREASGSLCLVRTASVSKDTYYELRDVSNKLVSGTKIGAARECVSVYCAANAWAVRSCIPCPNNSGVVGLHRHQHEEALLSSCLFFVKLFHVGPL